MAYLVGLVAAISVFWLGLSGHYSFPILPMGAGSLVFVIWFTMRLGILDRETSPYFLIPRVLGYWGWLLKEIVKANMTVVRAAVMATPDIEPSMTRVKTTCRSDLARVSFANSITLTPGTVTVDVEGDELLVHGLYAADLAPGAFDEMDRRCSEAFDGKS